MNRLFVVYKPPFISSNWFLGRIKRKYGEKKAGFSGTLDPIAKGVLVVAFGKYTRLFRFLAKAPKTYRATLWLGAESEGLDIEKITQVTELPILPEATVVQQVRALEKITEQVPPKFSAKWIDGKRAYDLARRGLAVDLPSIPIRVYETKFIAYCHPFVTFEATVSEGTYIRALALTLAQELGTVGSLSNLERLREGPFVFEDEKALDIWPYIDLPENTFLGRPEVMEKGLKLRRDQFENQSEGTYKLRIGDTLSVIEIGPEKITYIINRMEF